jgi:hypothetical protein
VRIVGLPLVALTVTGCYAHVTGDLQIDGAPFAATECRAGGPLGFPGIELADDQGRRLRLAQNMDGTLAGAYLPRGSQFGDALSSSCGAVYTQSGTGVINGVRNLDGSAALSCQTASHRVVGTSGSRTATDVHGRARPDGRVSLGRNHLEPGAIASWRSFVRNS